MSSYFQVKIWFQNRRNKWKRQLAADNEASNLRAFSGVPLFLQATAAAGNLNAANLAQAAAQATTGHGENDADHSVAFFP